LTTGPEIAGRADRPPPLIARLGYLALVYGLFLGVYPQINSRVPVAGALDLTLEIDRRTPLVVGFIYAFYLVYLLLLLPAFLVRGRRLLAQGALAFAVLVLASGLLFLLLPVTVPRPASLPAGLAGELLAAVYRNDRPVCGFPSLHVSASTLAALLLRRDRPRLGLGFFALALLTTVSVLFVKQHGVVDAAGGAALALLVDALLLARRPRRAPATPPGPGPAPS
jgi:membrane-associated phospholipid phosphatase